MAVLRPFPAIFWQLYDYISQNWGSDGHFEVLNRSIPWLIQKLWLKMQIFPFSFFCDIVKKMHLCLLQFWVLSSFCVITVVPIMIQTCSAPQNDSLNLRFVKYVHIVGKQMAKNCSKMVIYQMQILVISLSFNQDQVWPHAIFCVITFQPIKI